MLNLKKSLLITSLFVCGQSLQAEKFGVVIDKDRVAATFGNSGGSVFQYDEVGNLANEKRVSEAGKVLSERQYEYSDASKLWQVKDLLGDSVKSTHFGYDSLGRLTKVGDASMSYNQFNMMEAFKKPGVDARYTYNPLTGLRDAKVVNDKFTRFVLDDQERVVEERDMIGNVVSKITYDKNGPETYTRDGKTYRYVFNHLGDVVALKDSNGKVVNRYSYDVWGNLTLSQETVENPIRSRGEYYDSESGFYYLRGRYYDPNARRFTTSDPAEDGENWYTYCGNNPWNYVDPSGYVKVVMKATDAEYSGTTYKRIVSYYSDRHMARAFQFSNKKSPNATKCSIKTDKEVFMEL